VWYSPDNEPKDKNFDNLEQASCPVCKVAFGKRDLGEIYTAHCYECRATFTWFPWKLEPRAVLDKDEERKRCGCSSCEAKRKSI